MELKGGKPYIRSEKISKRTKLLHLLLISVVNQGLAIIVGVVLSEIHLILYDRALTWWWMWFIYLSAAFMATTTHWIGHKVNKKKEI